MARNAPKGRLLILGAHGGAPDGRDVVTRLAQLIGSGKLVMLSAGPADLEHSGQEYEAGFTAAGVSQLHHLHVQSQADAGAESALRELEGATGIFVTGDDPIQLTSILDGTPLYARIVEIFVQGGVVAGSGAGAMAMSEAFAVERDSARSLRVDDALDLAPGFGLAPGMIIDDQFPSPGRMNRLLGVVGQNPRVIAIGIDEDTAIELRPNRDFVVVGRGGVTVLDGRTVTISNVAEEERNRRMSIFGVTLHVLTHGDRFDLRSRRPRHHAAEEIERRLDGDAREQHDEPAREKRGGGSASEDERADSQGR